MKRGSRDNDDDRDGGGRHRNKRARRSDAAPRDGCTVFVGNLSYKTSWQDLKDHMRQAGNVDNANIFMESAGRSKGCGLVTYQNPKEAERAIRDLDASTLDGRKIFVSSDKRDGGEETAGGTLLFVGNLSYETRWQDLKDLFRSCGAIDRVEVMERPGDGKSKGFGLVKFARSGDAARAIDDMNGVELQGRRIEVRWDRDSAAPLANDRSAQPPPRRKNAPDNESEGGVQLFVGNLPFDVSWQDLKDYFKQCGRVDNAEVIEGADGKKRGFVIVRFFSEDDAQFAIRRLDGVEFKGRQLEVRLDRRGGGPKQPAFRDTHRGRDRAPTTESKSSQLFVGNLPFESSWQDLKDHFKQCGRVDNVEVVEGADGKKKGFGIVRFFSSDDAETAIRRLGGAEFQGRRLEVRLDKRPDFKPDRVPQGKNDKEDAKPPATEDEKPYDRGNALSSPLKSSR